MCVRFISMCHVMKNKILLKKTPSHFMNMLTIFYIYKRRPNV